MDETTETLPSGFLERLRKYRELPIVTQIFERLHVELPKTLFYHSVEHSEEVFREALLFAFLEGRSDIDLELIAIAAAYHDAGFINATTENEPIGAAMANAAMQACKIYSPEQVQLVERMILDTKLVNSPTGLRQIANTELSPYLLDADLSNLGRADFIEKSELHCRETEGNEKDFFEATLALLLSHRWLTRIACNLRQQQKEANILILEELVERGQSKDDRRNDLDLPLERMRFLIRLGLKLNSCLELERVVERALAEIKDILGAQAASLFLRKEGQTDLTFWAIQGGDETNLRGRKMPSGKGIVGWVVENESAVHVPNASEDSRFFAEVDRESSFETQDVLCVPLRVRGRRILGALQVLNSTNPGGFSDYDLAFLGHCANQLAPAVDNAQLWESLRERSRALEILDQRKGEMITVIMHEFRTPLGIVQSSADLLASGLLAEASAMERVADALRKGVLRLTDLVNQVRELALVSAPGRNNGGRGGLALTRSEIDLQEMFSQIERQFSEIVKARGQSFQVEVQKGAGTVYADAPLLLIVLDKLVSNAIRFTPDGGEIRLSAERRAGMVTIAVRDNGLGIEKSQQRLIYEKFYEVGEAMLHSSGRFEFKSAGLGVGLAVVQAILDQHASAIELDSTPGKGSKFYFSLPVAA